MKKLLEIRGNVSVWTVQGTLYFLYLLVSIAYWFLSFIGLYRWLICLFSKLGLNLLSSCISSASDESRKYWNQ